MKVVGFNGSPRKKGNTASSLNTVFAELEKAGIETEMVHVGKEKVRGCIACMGCVKEQDEACTIRDDPVYPLIHKYLGIGNLLIPNFSGYHITALSTLSDIMKRE